MDNISTNNAEIACTDENEEIQQATILELENMNSVPYAVRAEAVCYTYDHLLTRKRYVLNDLNIQVLKGQIYALLGPSGCGKSTLLKCVTGTSVPIRGNIVLSMEFARKKIPGPGVGYMPQELALLSDLTTRETLWLFGTLNGVPPDILTENIKRLSKMFKLAPGHQLVADLSGGQRRRVSLVCALLHDAPLLVLDEPTVGLDPILRKIIWDYMIDLTQTKKTTILLTTHYIEEAKDAHIVGLMRKGTLLAENSPSYLLHHFEETNLERCFHRICENKESEMNETSTSERYDKLHSQYGNEKDIAKFTALKKSNLRRNVSSDSNLSFVLNYVLPSLIVKNAKLLKRHYILLYFQFALPSIVILFCGICVGTEIFDLPLGIFNQESPPDLSVELLRHISFNRLNQISFDDKDSAIEFVKSGRSTMSLYIPAGFSTCLQNRIELGINTPEEDIKCGSVYLYADTTNRITSLTLHQMLIRSFAFFQMEYIRNYTDATPLIASIPVSFEKPVYGDMNASFTEYIVPSVLLVAIHFLAASLAGMNLINEKECGIMQRFSVCGVTKIQIFIAQLCTSLVIVFGQVFLLLATQFTLFETKIYGSYVLVVTLIFLQGVCGLLFAFFMAAIARTLLAASLGGIAAYFSTVIISGFIWPLEGMPHAMRWFARFIPVTQTIEALRSVMSRGWGLEHFEVQMGLLSVVSWSAFFLVAAILIFRAQN